MNSARLTAVLATAVLAVACGGTTTTMSEVAGPDVVRCQTSIANTPSAVPHSGSQVTLTVVAERECSWTARSEATWAQVSPTSGQGQGTISVTVTANTATTGRAAAIVVNDTRLNLNQEAAPCRFELGHTRSLMSSEGGRTEVNVATSGDCAWRASSNAAWAAVVNASGTGPGTIAIDVSPNTGAERTASISIADQTMVLVQEARSPDAPPGGTVCQVSLDSAERSFGPGGGDGSIRVSTDDRCSWNAVTNAPSWISLSGSAGTGSGTIGYRVSPNVSTTSRTGTITVSGRTHTVRQDAATSSGGGGEEPRIELSGLALVVLGSCPSISFLLELRPVFTNGDTRFRGDCGRIRTGTSVSVEGRVQSDGRVRATEVRVRNDD